MTEHTHVPRRPCLHWMEFVSTGTKIKIFRPTFVIDVMTDWLSRGARSGKSCRSLKYLQLVFTLGTGGTSWMKSGSWIRETLDGYTGKPQVYVRPATKYDITLLGGGERILGFCIPKNLPKLFVLVWKLRPGLHMINPTFADPRFQNPKILSWALAKEPGLMFLTHNLADQKVAWPSLGNW